MVIDWLDLLHAHGGGGLVLVRLERLGHRLDAAEIDVGGHLDPRIVAADDRLEDVQDALAVFCSICWT